jgi:hypothetical protein
VPLVTETNVSPEFFAWNQTHVDVDAPPPFWSAACVNRPVTDRDRRGVAASIRLSIMTAIPRPERRSPQVAQWKAQISHHRRSLTGRTPLDASDDPVGCIAQFPRFTAVG